ncbi:hypothetical protein BGW80DRAFT_1410450 [Lactifluus volemus]|nr:hypothetical protein BGW80DRAFT_1410450 [Lactifluus volemus]
MSTSTSMSTLWWEDPLDPVHVLDWCCDAMTQSGKMNGCVASREMQGSSGLSCISCGFHVSCASCVSHEPCPSY